jgi:hypothetical protein
MVDFRIQGVGDEDESRLLETDKSLVIGRTAARRAGISVGWTDDALIDLSALGPHVTRSVLNAALPTLNQAHNETSDVQNLATDINERWTAERLLSDIQVSTIAKNLIDKYRQITIDAPTETAISNKRRGIEDYSARETAQGIEQSDRIIPDQRRGERAHDFLLLYRDATVNERVAGGAEVVVARVLETGRDALMRKNAERFILPTLTSDIEY